MVWLIPAVYALGYSVTAVVAARHWFGRFGVELEGAAWAMFVALVWPLVAPAFAIKTVASRGL